MSESPLQLMFQGILKVSEFLQTHLPLFIRPSSSVTTNQKPLLYLSPQSPPNNLSQPDGTVKKSSGPITKEDLGRATWTFLHTLAAQYPDKPSRQQKKDVKELMAILSRMYPCKECADHFKDVIRANPVQAGSHDEFSQWLCHAHNVVNRSLGKLVFPCERVDARWGRLECENRACDLQATSMDFPK